MPTVDDAGSPIVEYDNGENRIKKLYPKIRRYMKSQGGIITIRAYARADGEREMYPGAWFDFKRNRYYDRRNYLEPVLGIREFHIHATAAFPEGLTEAQRRQIKRHLLTVTLRSNDPDDVHFMPVRNYELWESYIIKNAENTKRRPRSRTRLIARCLPKNAAKTDQSTVTVNSGIEQLVFDGKTCSFVPFCPEPSSNSNSLKERPADKRPAVQCDPSQCSAEPCEALSMAEPNALPTVAGQEYSGPITARLRVVGVGEVSVRRPMPTPIAVTLPSPARSP